MSSKSASKPDPFEEIAAALPTFEEEQALTLRQMGVRDPLPGCPMDVRTGPGEDDVEPVEPGEWRDKGLFERRSGLPLGCPVIPLGKDGATCYLLDTMGGVAELDAKSSGKGPIGFIFAGRSAWLEWCCPRRGRPSKMNPKGPVTGWDADDMRQLLVDACAYVGFFALEDQVRGRGAWRDDDGSLIYHAGDEVFIGGKWKPCGVHGRFIYPVRPKLGRPSGRPQPAGTGGPGDVLLEHLQTFNWDRGELDARLMLGWAMTAKLGGALDRRPVAFVTGAEGSGKSTLQALLRAVLNNGLIATSNTTQAGIYQRLQQDSVAILVDEFEAKDDTRTVDKILELARIAYSGDKMQRGGKDGTGKEFALNSSFMGSSISKPATNAQDDSRMVVLQLRERTAAGGKLDVTHAELEALGRQLTRRFFDWWDRWEDLQGAFRKTLIEAGHNDRSCDTFVPLAAAAHVALCDAMPDKGELQRWADWLRADRLAETAAREKTWARCFDYLLDAQPETWRNRSHKSVREVLNAFRAQEDGLKVVDSYLPQVGVTLSFNPGDPEDFEHARLFVAAKHPGLNGLFAGTQWQGRLSDPGPWCPVLRQMPRDFFENGVCRRGFGAVTRGMFIDLQQVLQALEEERTSK